MTVDVAHESYLYPSSFKRCFVTIPPAIPVVRTYSSKSAELKLTDCCVRDHAEGVAFPPCATPPLVLSLSRDTCQVSFDALHVHPVALSGTKDLSCCLLHAVHDASTLARSWHMYNTSPAAVPYTARCSVSSSTRDTVVGVLLTLGVATGLESYRPTTAITSRMHFGLASTKFPRAVLTITLPKKKI